MLTGVKPKTKHIAIVKTSMFAGKLLHEIVYPSPYLRILLFNKSMHELGLY